MRLITGIWVSSNQIEEMSEKHKDVSMETLEERVNKVINKLHDVKAMGVTISVDQRPEFRHLVSQTSEHIETVKDCLLDSVTNQLSPKQLSFLIRDTSSSACAGEDGFEGNIKKYLTTKTFR